MAAIRESDYMFTLTESGRANLNAVLEEFQRANRHYGPLYHLRLIPWSEDGEVSVSESQWEAFINSHTASPDDEDWWEWDGPHTAKPGFSYLSLGMWTGDPDGLQEFTDLANALVNVLSREHFSATDAPEHDFRSVSGWLSTVHYWAFKYQLPLLRSDMTLWGAEDSQSDQFFDLAEMQEESDGVSYPLHPLCFALVDNVFTSSATAIRAILQPAMVISTNEPWNGLLTEQHGESDDEPADSLFHRLVLTRAGWEIRPANSDRKMFSKYQTGLHRIAALIEHSPVVFKAEDLYKFGGRNFTSPRRKAKPRSVLSEFGISERESSNLNQEKDDPPYRLETGKKLRELLADRKQAEREGNEFWLEEINREIEIIHSEFHVTSDNTIKRQRPFVEPQPKEDYDAVATTIRNAIVDIKKQSLSIGQELEDQIPFPRLVFEPKSGLTPWRVQRIK